MVAKKHRNTAEAANPNAVKRRPSFEIANDFVELNFKPIIEVEAEESLSKAELKAKRKQERRERKQRHLLRNSIIAVICLVVVAGTTATIWWNSSNEPVNALDKNTYQFVVDEGSTVDEVASALRSADFIRSTLARRLKLRYMPQISFAFDSLQTDAMKLDALIKSGIGPGSSAE